MGNTYPIYVLLGRNIRRYREARHVTQAELGRMLGQYNQSYVSQLEKGMWHLPLHKVVACAEFLGVDYLDLLRDRPQSGDTASIHVENGQQTPHTRES